MCKTVLYKFLCLRCDWRYGHEIDYLACSKVTEGTQLLAHGACGIDQLIEVTRKKAWCGPCKAKAKQKAKK